MSQAANIPPGAIANLYIIDTTGTIAELPASHLVKPDLPTFETFAAVPSWSFLIESTTSTPPNTNTGRRRPPPPRRRVLFDLSIPKDSYNIAPMVSNRLRTMPFVIDAPNSVAEVLTETPTPTLGAASVGNQEVQLDDIEAVIWSHYHWDHQGDLDHFPATTELVVGPGFSEAFLPAYPEGPTSPILQKSLEGRRVREVNFDKLDNTTEIWGIRAWDFFGDGSFYILDTPGHAVGHLGGLVRTTTNPDTFVFLGGDLTHHGGELRPSKHLSLAAAAASVGTESETFSGIAQRSLEALQTSRGRRTDQAFFDPSLTHDFDEALATIEKTQEADGSDNVFFIGAHDDTVKGIVDTFPQTANDWKMQGWREKSLWAFLRDFRGALDPITAFNTKAMRCPC